MADLVLEAYDRFVILYDLLALVKENAICESLGSVADLSSGAASQILSFLLMQVFVKTIGSDSAFRITALGSNLLQDVQGMRRFLS